MKTNVILIFTSLLSITTSSCKSQGTSINSSIVDACTIKGDIKKYLPEIKKNTKNIITKGKDECVLGLMDTLAVKFIAKSDDKYLQSLDDICQVADGYVGEHLWSIGQRLFYDKFYEYFKYIYKRKNQQNSCIKKLFIESISVELNGAKDRKAKRNEVDEYINKQVLKYKLSKEEIDFLKSLEAQFNDKILD